MKQLKLFPKIFLYTLGIMLFVVAVTHGLIYLLAPRMQLAMSTQEDVVISIRQEEFVTEAVKKALPFSLSCSLVISVVCSLLLSKAITDPIKKISASTEKMMELDRGASCSVYTRDEIGTLAQNVNDLYSNLLSTIEQLEQEKDAVRDKALPGIDWTAFTIEADNETYENAAAPLATLNELVVTLLVVIIVVSAIILALILTLWTKTRIHEIGVFLSVGIKKSAIVGQYLVEVLLIAVLAFGLSYFTSNAIAGQIGNRLLEQSTQAEPGDNDVVSAAASVEIGADNLIQNPLPTENGIQVSVGLDNLAQLYLIGLAIIIVAVSASSITVMRLKPREILSKMS